MVPGTSVDPLQICHWSINIPMLQKLVVVGPAGTRVALTMKLPESESVVFSLPRGLSHGSERVV